MSCAWKNHNCKIGAIVGMTLKYFLSLPPLVAFVSQENFKFSEFHDFTEFKLKNRLTEKDIFKFPKIISLSFSNRSTGK